MGFFLPQIKIFFLVVYSGFPSEYAVFLVTEMVGLNQVERPTILGGGSVTFAAGAFPPPSL